jgi:predicted Zn-dependent protease
VQSSWHAARGALLMQEGKYQEAIAHLAEDQDDPYSLGLLSQAYAEQGDTDRRHEVEIRLRGLNVPTIEHAVVVPAARAQRPKL